MKRTWIVLAVLIVVSLFIQAADLPPAFPSSFWGYTSGIKAGTTITTNTGNYTTAFEWQGKVVYTIGVTGGVEGQQVIFYANKKIVGYGVYHSGTNQRVDLAGRVVPGVMPVKRLVSLGRRR